MSENNWEYSYTGGVTIEGDHILWYERLGACAFASGGSACEQTFEHFLANGPWVDNVPPEVIDELTRAVRTRMKAP